MLEDPLNLRSLKVKESVMETVRVWEHQMRDTDLIGLVTRRKPKEWEPEVPGNLDSDIANRLNPKSWDMGTDGSFRFDPSNSEESYSKWGVFAVEEGLLEQGRPVDRVALEKGKVIVGELDPFTFCVNASELKAVVQGLRSVPLQDSVNLVVDSMYVVSGIKKCCDVREIGNGKLEIVKVKENWELPSHRQWMEQSYRALWVQLKGMVTRKVGEGGVITIKHINSHQVVGKHPVTCGWGWDGSQ